MKRLLFLLLIPGFLACSKPAVQKSEAPAENIDSIELVRADTVEKQNDSAEVTYYEYIP